jgi:hypothetical protein
MTFALALCLACPLCAERPVSEATTVAVLAFIAVPFVVAGLVLRAVRNAGS